MTQTISHSSTFSFESDVRRAAEAANNFEVWLASVQPASLRLSRGPIIDTFPRFREEPDDPTTEAYWNSNQQGPKVVGVVHVRDMTLHGTTTDGRHVSYCLGEYDQLPHSLADTAESHLRYLRARSSRLARELAACQVRIASGELVISPTAEEETAAHRKQERQRQQGWHARSVNAARQRLAAYRRDEVAYRTNGHDIDAMIAAEEAIIATPAE